MATLGVTITSGPQDWQILQRDEAGMGHFTIKGTWQSSETVFSIQARLVDQQTNAPVARHLDWQDAELDLTKTMFTLTFKNIPTGGLYRVETRLRRPQAGDKRAMRGDCIHHLGVGDLYVITGQSNASGTGKGAAADGPELGVHLFANDEKWKLAIHPLEDATNTLHPCTVTGVFHGHSPWLAFAKRIKAKTGIPIGLIPTALGGSPISMWVQDSGQPASLFDNMMDMINKAGGRVAGVLWHQGESDTPPDAIDKYTERFNLLVKLFRKMLNDPKLPIITGQLNTYVNNQGDHVRWTQMREIQRQLSHDLDRVYMAVTIDCPLSDEIHNNAIANVIVGERYADLALSHIYNQPILAEHPEPTKVRFTDASRKAIEITFTNLSGDWTPNTGANSFTAQDADGNIQIEQVELGFDGRIRIRLSRPAKNNAMLHALYGLKPEQNLRDDGGRIVTPFSLPIIE